MISEETTCPRICASTFIRRPMCKGRSGSKWPNPRSAPKLPSACTAPAPNYLRTHVVLVMKGRLQLLSEAVATDGIAFVSSTLALHLDHEHDVDATRVLVLLLLRRLRRKLWALRLNWGAGRCRIQSCGYWCGGRGAHRLRRGRSCRRGSFRLLKLRHRRSNQVLRRSAQELAIQAGGGLPCRTHELLLDGTFRDALVELFRFLDDGQHHGDEGELGVHVRSHVDCLRCRALRNVARRIPNRVHHCVADDVHRGHDKTVFDQRVLRRHGRFRRPVHAEGRRFHRHVQRCHQTVVDLPESRVDEVGERNAHCDQLFLDPEDRLRHKRGQVPNHPLQRADEHDVELVDLFLAPCDGLNFLDFVEKGFHCRRAAVHHVTRKSREYLRQAGNRFLAALKLRSDTLFQ
mmetsp:Transcript_22278/g.56285  ORF Transcript_22278/g.56285 Transcript_22278/m.56285 type:complete len:403 (-) Transcript_22278:210-1418(-)